MKTSWLLQQGRCWRNQQTTKRSKQARTSPKSKRRSASDLEASAEGQVQDRPVKRHKKAKLNEEHAARNASQGSHDTTAQNNADQPAASLGGPQRPQRKRKRARASTAGLTEDELSRRERQREAQVQILVFAVSRQLLFRLTVYSLLLSSCVRLYPIDATLARRDKPGLPKQLENSIRKASNRPAKQANERKQASTAGSTKKPF